MYINDVLLDSRVDLMDKEIIDAEKVDEVENMSTLLSPYIARKTYNLGSIKLILGFRESTYKALKDFVSSFVLSLSECKLKFDDVDYYYDCGYISKNIDQPPFQEFYNNNTWYTQITFEFAIIKKYKDMITTTFNQSSSKTITLNSTKESNCIIEVTPTIDLVDLTINGVSTSKITITALRKGVKICIDGINKKVTMDNKNYFSNVDLWQFPRLLPGSNTITVDKTTCNINIKYYPCYL